MKKVTIKAVRKRIPACALAAVEACESDPACGAIENIIAGVEHELDLYREGEENISHRAAFLCSSFLKWVQSVEVKQ